MEDQPLPTDASPTALSLDYVVDSEDEKDPKEDPADYPCLPRLHDKNLVRIVPALASSHSTLFPYSHITPFFNHT
nr:hypothetical protein [Tanacetum cinerariifolium]